VSLDEHLHPEHQITLQTARRAPWSINTTRDRGAATIDRRSLTSVRSPVAGCGGGGPRPRQEATLDKPPDCRYVSHAGGR